MGFDLARDRHHSRWTGRRAYRVGLAPPPFRKRSGEGFRPSEVSRSRTSTPALRRSCVGGFRTDGAKLPCVGPVAQG
jgi:hypothetical protein